jgi:hypothetical protein
MKKINVSLPTYLTLVAIVLAAIGGWIANIVKLFSMFGDNIEITTMFVGRIVGIFIGPLGAVLGYM